MKNRRYHTELHKLYISREENWKEEGWLHPIPKEECSFDTYYINHFSLSAFFVEIYIFQGRILLPIYSIRCIY